MCVFQRFGCALTMTGQLNLKNKKFSKDFKPIDDTCDCSTCEKYTRAYLYQIATVYPVACSLISVHNVAFQLRLMRNIQESIKENRFPEFVKEFMKNLYSDRNYPGWIVDALKAVNISLE